MKRNNILAKKRLMKTTTYITALLVAVTMILSGSATVATVNGNENISMEESTPTAPGSIGGFDSADDSEDPVICTTDKEFEYSGAYRSLLVYDNGMSYSSGWSSQNDPSFPYDAYLADDFVLGADKDVSGVNWMASDSPPFGYDIEFYEDDGTGNRPGASIGLFSLDNADITAIPVGSRWELQGDLSDVISFTGGQKYWISIWGNTPLFPQTFVGVHLTPITNHESIWKSNYWGVPDWTDGGGYFGYTTDMSFQLTIKPTHDVYADAILAPTSLSAFCPCTPVEATFKNAGLIDETDVPVSVEIRRYQTDEFEFNMPTFDPYWEMFPWGNIWFTSTIEAAYPGYVTPHTPPFMAELDSGLTGPGGADLVSIPIDISEKCHPMLSFYMWHDEYGSDDFISVYANDGGGWIDIGGPFYRLCCPDCPNGWMEHTLDLSAFTGAVQITFEGNCDSNAGAYELMIDTVNVYDQEYFEEDEVDIDVGQTVTVEFPEWCPCHWQEPAWANTSFDIEVIACTALDTDEIPANDCVSEDLTMYLPLLHDIAAISIDKPVDNVVPVDTFEMCGTIKNVGQYEECCFSVYMTVQEVDVIGFDETFDDWEDNPDHYPSYYPLGKRPVGWTETNSRYYDIGWEKSNTNNAGGTAPEAYLAWNYAGYYLDNTITSPSVNTIGVDELHLEFKSFIDIYYTSGVYCYVEVTSDGSSWDEVQPWTNPPSANVGPDTYSIDISSYMGSGTQVRFTFNGYYFALDYWFVDDVKILGYTFGDIEYEDSYCVDTIDVCEEMQICFDDWTPATPYPDCGEITYLICLETKLCDPMDENPANDITCEFITVEFWHDVSINEITNPADDDRVDFLGYHDGHTENAWQYTAGDDWQCAIQLTDALLAPYRGDEITEVLFSCGCDDYGFNNADYEIWISDQLEDPTAPPVVHGTGTSSGTGWDTVTLQTAYQIPNTGDVYLGLTWSNYDQFPAGVDDDNYVPEGFWFYYGGWIDAATVLGPAVWGISAGVTAGGGPPSIDLYIPCGEQDFCATFENLGTFDEPGCIIDWTLYEWNTDPQNPTYVTGGSEPIDLDIGEVLEDYCFGSYNFVDEGIYELVVEIIAPGVDCYIDNNGPLSIALGVDCCPPETTFVLDPEQPDGENNWFISEITVTVDAVDCCDPPHVGSGVKEIKYKVNGVEGTITGDHGTIMLEDDGVHLVELWAIDNAGNEEAQHHTFEVAIDTGDPSIDLIYEAYEEDDGWHVDFTALASDDTSGIEKVEFYIGSSLEGTLTEAPFVWSIAWEDGYETTTFKATAYDNAGNSASDTVDGSIIEAVPYFHSQPAVPVWLVQPVQQLQQQQTNSLVQL